MATSDTKVKLLRLANVHYLQILWDWKLFSHASHAFVAGLGPFYSSYERAAILGQCYQHF